MTRKSARIVLLALFSGGAAAGCVSREIYHPRGCEERLSIPYKRMECMACVTRPRPHVFLPDNPDGMRCTAR
jgi:hypothetical protein